MRLQVFNHCCLVIWVPASHISLQAARSRSCRLCAGLGDGRFGSSAKGGAAEGRRWLKDVGLPPGDPAPVADADEPPALVCATDGPVPRLVTITRMSSRMEGFSHAGKCAKAPMQQAGWRALKGRQHEYGEQI